MQITYKDKTVTLAKLSISDNLKHLAFIKDSLATEVKRHLVGLPLELCKYAWDKLREELAQLDIGTPLHIKELLSLRHLAHALYLAAVKEFGDYTITDAMNEIEKDPVGVARNIVRDLLEIELGS